MINNENITLTEPDRQFYFIEKCKEWLDTEKNRTGRTFTASIVTFGCQMNSKDSEKLAGILTAIGYKMVEDEKADFVLYNTCTVRENANTRVYGRIGFLGNLKKKNPDMLIAICGCMMQEADEVEKIKKTYRFVDIVFGTHNVYKLAELLYQRVMGGKRTIEVLEKTDLIVENLPSELKYPFKAGVNIMYGCNNFCSYCIVPYVRGRERSREPEDIIAEIKSMVSKGIVEIMLLGQNVNSYGKTLSNPISFSELLKRIEPIEGLERIRFMTSHPKDLSDELIETIKNSKKICRHLHLPMQSGSTEILKKMNRRYTKESYLALANKIKTAIPDISLTTDIIVGFPGETEEDFLDTLDVVRQVQFDSAYTFIYSKRTGTPAAEMENQIPEEVTKERFNRLISEIQHISDGNTKKLEGQTVDVLVEEINEQDDSLMTGRMSNNLLVHFKGGHDLLGKLLKVKLVSCKGFYFMGELVS